MEPYIKHYIRLLFLALFLLKVADVAISTHYFHFDCTTECTLDHGLENTTGDNLEKEVDEVKVANLNNQNPKVTEKSKLLCKSFFLTNFANTQHLEYETPPPELV